MDAVWKQDNYHRDSKREEGQYYKLKKILPLGIKNALEQNKVQYDNLQEIRIRVNQPVSILWNNEEYIITTQGRICKMSDQPLILSSEVVTDCMARISNYSLYAWEEELKQGFITIQGGHRIGVAGQTVADHRMVQRMNHISFLNIRLSHEVIGCAKPVFHYITKQNIIHNTLIISPAGCGKTTLLRDLIRFISNGTKQFAGINVGVVDERSEIAACYQGVPQNDLGARTDVLDCCPKIYGMNMLIRSMSPKVIAVDEIGTDEDAKMLHHIMTCGCRILATAHGDNLEDIKRRPAFQEMLKQELFTRFIVLERAKAPGQIAGVYDEAFRELMKPCGIE